MRPVLLAALCLAGCQATTVRHEGRPCSESEPCGGGLFCDPVTRVCVGHGTSDARADRPLLDGPLASDLPRDGALATERLARDRSPEATPRDQSGCSPACAPGQDCVGGTCRCVTGGACEGCCKGDDCIALASQQVSVCGLKGQACISCVDGNECTSEACSKGACLISPLPDGTPCLGGSCKSGGCNGCTPSCGGKQCGPDGCGGSCGSCATPPNTTCNTNGQCVCTPACAGKSCGPDGCGGQCGSCGSGSYCASGSCTACPTCASLGYYTGALRSCRFDGSNGCWCPGTDGNNNNLCDSGESCWGSDNCSSGDHNPANCTTRQNISVPAGCTPPAYCIECS